ncbi:MAG TPA: ABC transporter ATP-binding protein [Cellulomonas sp.]
MVTAQRVQVGDEVVPGTVLVEVSDRPLIALPLPFPLFRDLHRGDTGSDVAALEALDTLRTEAAPGAPEPVGLSAARTTLAEAQARAGAWLPAAEVVALERGSVVTAVAPVRTTLDDGLPVVSLRSGAPTVTARADLSVAGGFSVGTPVVVSEVGGDGSATGVVGEVGEVGTFQEGTAELAPGYDLRVDLDDGAELPDGTRELLTPAAVRDEGGGLAVLVLDSAPDVVPVQTRRVDVAVLLSADGQAVVEAALAPGGPGRGRPVTTVVAASGLHRRYVDGDRDVVALRGASITLDAGERVAVTGRSGAGKSTLASILGLLDEPDSGTYRLVGQETATMSARQRDRLRRDAIGFVFQAFHVLGNRTVWDNVHLKLATARSAGPDRAALIRAALDAVGLREHAEAPARLLSGGEKQRLAIARAVVLPPALLLADEPTGSLDTEKAAAVLDLLRGLADREIAVLVITHDPVVTRWADRTVQLRDGREVPA